MKRKCWPLHPQPIEDEALSSWLNHVASHYHLSLEDLLKYDLGFETPAYDLDLNPPATLLKSIEKRSNLTFYQIRNMTFSSWVPFIIDQLDPHDNLFQAYVFQYSVLRKCKYRASPQISHWYPWLCGKRVLRVCLECIKSYHPYFIRLSWKLPLMLSCPIHGCWLQVSSIYPNYYVAWDKESPISNNVPEEVHYMDRLTWQAIMVGEVRLPKFKVHAGVWFRLLRSLLHELSIPPSTYQDWGNNIKMIWGKCDHPVRGGLNAWRPYEYLSFDIQTQLLEGAATAIDMIMKNEIIPKGHNSKLFIPDPIYESDIRSSYRIEEKSNQDPWPSLNELFEQVLAEARIKHETALQLRSFSLYGRNDLKSIMEIDTLFSELGIPFKFTSHN